MRSDGGSPGEGGSRIELLDLLLLLAGLIVATAAFFYPLVLDLTGSVLFPKFGGQSVVQQARDQYHFIWNFWWVRQAIATHQNIFSTNLMFYPQGTPLILQTIDYVDAAFAAPFSVAFGEVFGYNLIVLASFPLAGITSFLLAWHFTRSKLASGIAGFIFAFFPQHVAQAIFGHPNIASVGWLPAYFLTMLLAFERKSIRYAALAGGLAAVMTLVDLEWLLWAAIASAIYLVYYLLTTRLSDIRKTLAVSLVIVGVGLGLSSPYLVPAYTAVSTQARAPPAVNQAFQNSAVPSLYLTPFPYNALFGHAFAAAYNGLSGGPANWIIYVGWTVIALAAIGLVTSDDRRKYFLVAVAFVFVLFSLGPARTELPLSVQTPYTFLYDHISVLHYERSSARYSIVAMLSLSILAAMGAKSVFEVLDARASRIPWGKIAAAAILVLLLVEFAPSLGATAVTSSPAYSRIASTTGDFGVLELPQTITLTQNYLYQATLTGKPLVNGKVSQVSQTLPLYAYTQPFLRELISPIRATKLPKDIVEQPFNESSLAPVVLTQYRIKYVLLNTQYFVSPTEFDRVYADLFNALGPPVYQDKETVLFELAQWETTAEILQSVHSVPLTSFGSGWGPLTNLGRTANDSAQLIVYASLPQLYSLTMAVGAGSVCVSNLNVSASSTCGAFDLASETYVYQIPLGTGMNVLSLQVAGGPAPITLIRFSPAS